MMGNTKLLKLCAATLLSGTIAAFSLTVNAEEENFYPSTACLTSNTATGTNFFRGRDGLQNNSNVDRFVTCPFVIDRSEWDATPALSIEVNVYMPVDYGPEGAPGLKCFVRFLVAGPGDDNPAQATVVNQTMTFGTNNINAGTGDADASIVDINVNNDTDGNGYVVCVVPKNGGQIRVYEIRSL